MRQGLPHFNKPSICIGHNIGFIEFYNFDKFEVMSELLEAAEILKIIKFTM